MIALRLFADKATTLTLLTKTRNGELVSGEFHHCQIYLDLQNESTRTMIGNFQSGTETPHLVTLIMELSHEFERVLEKIRKAEDNSLVEIKLKQDHRILNEFKRGARLLIMHLSGVSLEFSIENSENITAIPLSCVLLASPPR